MLTHEILLDNLYEDVFENYKETLAIIARDESYLAQIARETLSPERSHEQIKMLERMIGRPVRGLRIMELGSGNGITVVTAEQEYGAEAYGLEPGEDEFSGSYAVGQKVLALAGMPGDRITQGVGEKMPYPDESFDVVFSTQVLEHVQDPKAVIEECIRILKPGGFMHHIVPNYNSWWEGHYGVLWIPNMPAWLGKLYIRLYRRDPAFIDALQLINPRQLKRILAPYVQRGDVVITGWGQNVWEERVRSIDFSAWATLSRVKNILELLHKLKLIDLLIVVGKWLRWETPIILTVKKQ